MRSGDKEVASAAVCQGPAARASMDKKTPKKNRHSERPRGGRGCTSRLWARKANPPPTPLCNGCPGQTLFCLGTHEALWANITVPPGTSHDSLHSAYTVALSELKDIADAILALQPSALAHVLDSPFAVCAPQTTLFDPLAALPRSRGGHQGLRLSTKSRRLLSNRRQLSSNRQRSPATLLSILQPPAATLQLPPAILKPPPVTLQLPSLTLTAVGCPPVSLSCTACRWSADWASPGASSAPTPVCRAGE